MFINSIFGGDTDDDEDLEYDCVNQPENTNNFYSISQEDSFGYDREQQTSYGPNTNDDDYNSYDYAKSDASNELVDNNYYDQNSVSGHYHDYYESYELEDYNDLGNGYPNNSDNDYYDEINHQTGEIESQNLCSNETQFQDDYSQDSYDADRLETENEQHNSAIHIPLPAAAAGVLSTAAFVFGKASGKSNQEAMGMAGTTLGFVGTLASLRLIPDGDIDLFQEQKSQDCDEDESEF